MTTEPPLPDWDIPTPPAVVAADTVWVPAPSAGPACGGPPAHAARLFVPAGGDPWPRLRLAVRYPGGQCRAWLKAEPGDGWFRVPVPASLADEATDLGVA